MAGFLSRLAEQARGSAAVARPLIPQMMGAGPRMAESLASFLGGRFHSEAEGNGAGDFETNIERVIGTDNSVLNSEGIEPRLPTAEESLRPARDPRTTITGTTIGSFLPNAYRSQPSQAEDLHSDPHAAPALPGGTGATRDQAGRRVSLDSADRRLRIPAETRRVVPAEVPRAGDLLTAGERSTTREELSRLQPEQGDHVRPPTRGNGDGARTPVIHVTIGRVDVRAILPSPPATPSAPTSSQLGLTLEEYAKQRNRRAR
jgi:hypothetical protein